MKLSLYQVDAFASRPFAGNPAAIVDLCGHATLASAWVVFEKLEPGRKEVTFSSKSGPLRVAREGDSAR